jgi:aldose 1-epimerase
MLYADPDLDVFCLEPQTNASCAFNKLTNATVNELGVLILEPGELASGTVTLRVAELR